MSEQKTVVGRRVHCNQEGYLSEEINKPATYGRASAERVRGTRVGWWQVTTPDGHVGGLNPEVHTVTEHADGTITVTPSIDMSQRHPGGWHGWLTQGVFRSV